MVERNGPCPCGSGKTYKKCCAKKDDIPQTRLVNEELERIVTNYSEQLVRKSPIHLDNLENLNEKWRKRLGSFMPAENIDMLAIEYYLFFEQREQWSRYILKTLNGSIRQQTREILKNWHQPIMLIGKVTHMTDQYIEIEEVLGHATYRIENGTLAHIGEKDLLVGIILKDTRIRENGFYTLGEILGIRDMNDNFMRKIQTLAENSQENNAVEFFEKHMLDVYEVLMETGDDTIQEVASNQLNLAQQQVLIALADELEYIDILPEQKDIAQMLAVSFLIEKKPTFRKPETVAAAIFMAMENYGMLDNHTHLTQKAVAKMFGVSVSSMVKHVEPVEEMIENMYDDMMSEESSEGDPTYSYHIGTDPRATERVNWEIACKMMEMEASEVTNIEQMLNEAMEQSFIPNGKAQMAQVIAYEAYEQAEYEERVRFAKRAYAVDPNNVDAILLKAENEEIDSVAEKEYQRAVRIAEGTIDFSDTENVWRVVTNRPYLRALFAYGIFHYEQEEYEQALAIFRKLLKINPNDNQCARHLAIASAIHHGSYALARQLINQFGPTELDENIYDFFEALIDSKRRRRADIYDAMIEINIYTAFILENDMVDLPYPGESFIEPDSAEEAFYMVYLSNK